MTDDDAARVAEIARRLADARSDRIRATSRCASELEALARPLNDRHIFKLIARLQARLAERLPALPNPAPDDGDG